METFVSQPRVSEYRSQHELREWEHLYDALPDLGGAVILDLGCGPGFQSNDLARRGATVIGVDSNAELIEHANAQAHSNCQFVAGNVRELADLGIAEVDGIWSSFTIAYCVGLEDTLRTWMSQLKPSGWLAIVEVSGLFDHEPIPTRFRDRLSDFYRQRFDAGTYDFCAGRRLTETLEALGLRIDQHTLVQDAELSADGPLSPRAVMSWERRFRRMGGLATFFDQDFDAFREAFMLALTHEEHRSACDVHFVLASKALGSPRSA